MRAERREVRIETECSQNDAGATVDFRGAKLALLVGARLVTILRDDRPDIPFPAQWDFPGGGREGTETPQVCALRETHEEIGLTLSEDDIFWSRAYGTAPGTVWFFVVPLAGLDTARLRLGDEGQCWRLMPIEEYLRRSDAIPMFQDRLAEYLVAEPSLV